MWFGVLAVLGAMWIANSSMYLSDEQRLLQVNCPDPQGCFGQIQRVLSAAPAGSTIRIGPGVFYERPLVVDKSLTLEGAGANLTEIRTVDSGAAITIRSAEPVSVTLLGLAITVPLLWDADAMGVSMQSVGIQWIQRSPTDKEQTVTIKECRVTSNIGVDIDGWKGSLVIGQSHLWGISAGLRIAARGEVKVAAEGSSFLGPLRSDVFRSLFSLIASAAISVEARSSPGKAYILLKDNQMQFWHYGFSAASAGHEGWSRTEALLVGNAMTSNKEAGVYLVGDAQAELRENRISDNGYGVELFLPPCVLIAPNDILAFRGTVKGQDNAITNNKKGDLCPEDYPWPPGFRK